MKIIAVGMNYAAHNKELENTLLIPEEPVIFCKPDSALQKAHRPFFVPDFAEEFEYETEVVIRMCRQGRSIPERFAHRYYNAVTVGIDFTARDLQRKLRAEGKPWELSKGFDNSAFVGEFIDIPEGKDIQDLHFHLDIDGKTVQKGWTGDMIFTADKIVSFVSRFLTVKVGDIIFTGTPAGVGKVSEGMFLEGYLEDKKLLDLRVK